LLLCFSSKIQMITHGIEQELRSQCFTQSCPTWRMHDHGFNAGFKGQ